MCVYKKYFQHYIFLVHFHFHAHFDTQKNGKHHVFSSQIPLKSQKSPFQCVESRSVSTAASALQSWHSGHLPAAGTPGLRRKVKQDETVCLPKSLVDLYQISSMDLWYIHLHEWLIFMVNVSKHTSPMDPMGYGKF